MGDYLGLSDGWAWNANVPVKERQQEITQAEEEGKCEDPGKLEWREHKAGNSECQPPGDGKGKEWILP